MTTTDSRPQTGYKLGHGPRNTHTVRRAATAPPSSHGVNSWERSEWVSHALCREDCGDSLFVKGAAQRAAALRCRECPVLLQCRADALDSGVEFGVWGGMTERERRSILRTFPDLPSWRNLLDPTTQEDTLKYGRGRPAEALEALDTLSVNAERRYKRRQSSTMQKFNKVLNEISTRVDGARESDDDSEIETFEAIATLREFEIKNEKESK